MRPLSLAIEGFTAFRERQEIDFEPLELFVITGPTGAGKTSILDAMVFALYGEVPRLGGKQGTSDVVSLGDDDRAPSSSSSRSTARGGYRVARRVSRAGQLAQTATLERREGSDWVPACRGRRERECNQKIARAVGLDFDAFTRAVVLPQGEFHRFLKGDVAERRQVLFACSASPTSSAWRRSHGTRQAGARGCGQRTEELLGEQYADATAEHFAELKLVAAGAADALTVDLRSGHERCRTVRDRRFIGKAGGRARDRSARELTVVAADLTPAQSGRAQRRSAASPRSLRSTTKGCAQGGPRRRRAAEPHARNPSPRSAPSVIWQRRPRPRDARRARQRGETAAGGAADAKDELARATRAGRRQTAPNMLAAADDANGRRGGSRGNAATHHRQTKRMRASTSPDAARARTPQDD